MMGMSSRKDQLLQREDRQDHQDYRQAGFMLPVIWFALPVLSALPVSHWISSAASDRLVCTLQRDVRNGDSTKALRGTLNAPIVYL